MRPIFAGLHPGHSPPTVALSNTPPSHSDSSAPQSPVTSPLFSPALAALKLHQLPDEDVTPLSPAVSTICCVGAGYVGGPTATVMAYYNPQIRVTVVDRDPGRIRRWQSPHLPIYEPGLTPLVRVARDGTRAHTYDPLPNAPVFDSSDSETPERFVRRPTGKIPARAPNLFFSTDVAGEISRADIVLVAVNTPTKKKGFGGGKATDMTAFEAVVAEVARHAKPGAIIVEKSTVPCRTAEMVRETMAIHRPGVDFQVLSNPEFLAAGTAVNDLINPSRILIGCPPTHTGRLAGATLASIYAAWIPRNRILTSNVYSSELAKLVANSFLAQRISSINSISALCEDLGADITQISAALGADPRIGSQFLKAGLGFGGSCFRKDVLSLVYIAESLHRYDVADYWRGVVEMNEGQRERYVRRALGYLNGTVRGKKIVVLGYAFKKNTSDTRESPALEVIRTLLEEGPGEVAVFDPCCNLIVMRAELEEELPGLTSWKVYEDVYEACTGADALLIATDFDEFRSQSKIPSDSPTKTLPVDPRPFTAVIPTLENLAALSTYLTSQDPSTTDPLDRLLPEPPCDVSCPDCRLHSASSQPISAAALSGAPSSKSAGSPVDWSRISQVVRRPGWVFDGRDIVDKEDLEPLGFRVVQIGKRYVG